jgi:hypothetical protein
MTIYPLQDANVGCASADDAEALSQRGGEREIAANPAPRVMATDIYHGIVVPAKLRNEKPFLSASDLGIKGKDIFSTSAKLGNSPEFGWWTPGLYLASGETSQVMDLCTHASDGCRLNCLLVSGQREMMANTAKEVGERLLRGDEMSSPTNLSLLRTYLYHYGYDEFMALLHDEIERQRGIASEQGLELAVRLNATSDIMWEVKGIIDQFSDVIFYDYTKIPQRVVRFLSSGAPKEFRKASALRQPKWASNPAVPDFPSNYFLAFSYSEVNLAWCLILLDMGANVVVPFTETLGREPWGHTTKTRVPVKGILPETFLGRPVIDGDAYDMRFIDNAFWGQQTGKRPPYVVGLRVKGHFQRKNVNAFFFDAHEAQALGSSTEFIADAVYHNTREAMAQNLRSQLPALALAEEHLDPLVFEAFRQALSEN